MKEKIIFDRNQHKIAIIAPSHGCLEPHEKLLMAQEILKLKGFECLWDENILSGHKTLNYLASSEDQRVHELTSALKNAEVGIIWLFRGGSDSLEIALKCREIKPSGDKIFIGFSDGTCLHALFNDSFRVPSIHGPVINTLIGSQKEMLDELIDVLSGEDLKLKLETMNEKAKGAKITGQTTGGNLCVISDSLIGTDLHPNMDDKIIFLEDVGEQPYALRRALNHLKNAKLFLNAKAIIFGDFTFNDSKLTNEANIEMEKQIILTLKDFAENVLPHIPIFKVSGVGHAGVNHPVVMMGDATIENDILTIESPFELI